MVNKKMAKIRKKEKIIKVNTTETKPSKAHCSANAIGGKVALGASFCQSKGEQLHLCSVLPDRKRRVSSISTSN